MTGTWRARQIRDELLPKAQRDLEDWEDRARHCDDGADKFDAQYYVNISRRSVALLEAELEDDYGADWDPLLEDKALDEYREQRGVSYPVGIYQEFTI